MNSTTTTAAVSASMSAAFDPSVLPQPVVWGILGGCAAIVISLVVYHKTKNKKDDDE